MAESIRLAISVCLFVYEYIKSVECKHREHKIHDMCYQGCTM